MQSPNRFSIIEYYQIKDLLPYMKKFAQDQGTGGVFVVPQSFDKSTIAKMLAPSSFLTPPPKVITIGDLYSELAEACGTEPLFVIDPPDHTLILKYIVREFIAECEEEGVELPVGVLQGGFPKALGDELRELVTEDVSPSDFAARLALEGDELSPEHILATLYKSYEGYLSSHKITDVYSVPHHARKLIETNQKAGEYLSGRNFFFLGFLSLTGSQLALVREVSRYTASRVLIGSPRVDTEGFQGIAAQIGNFEKTSADYSRQRRERKSISFRASNVELEAQTIARQIALWQNNCGLFHEAFGDFASLSDLGLLCSKENVAVFRSAFNRYKIPWNEEEIATVADNIVGRLPQLIWQTFESACQESAVRSFLSSFAFADLQGGELLQVSRDEHPYSKEMWLELLTEDAKSTLASAENFYGTLKAGVTPYELLFSYHKFLEEIKLGERITALTQEKPNLDYIAKSVNNSIFEVGKKAKYMADLATAVGEATNETLTGSEALDFFASWASASTLPVTMPLASCVTIWTKVPPTFTARKYFFISNCDASHYPKTLHESELLSPEAKEKFNKNLEGSPLHISHIPSIAEKRLQEEAIFCRLTETAESGLVFTCTASDDKGRPVFASPFLAKFLERTGQKANLHNITLDDLFPTASEDRLKGSEAPRECNLEAETPPALTCEPHTVPYISPSHLDSARCHFKFYLENFLHLDDERVRLLDPRAMGNLMHKLFEDGFAEMKNGRCDSLLQFVTENVEGHATKIVMGSPLCPNLFTDPRLAITALDFKRKLTEMARYLDTLGSRCNANGLTQTLQEFDLEFNGQLPISDKEKSKLCHIKGRADRIDIFGDEAVILDYKSNKAKDHKNDLQLPLYAVILPQIMKGLNVSSVAWLGLGDTKGNIIAANTSNKKKFKEVYECYDKCTHVFDANLENRKAEALQVLAPLLDLMTDGGEWKPTYKINGKDNPACQYCNYRSICRKQAMENE